MIVKEKERKFKKRFWVNVQTTYLEKDVLFREYAAKGEKVDNSGLSCGE